MVEACVEFDYESKEDDELTLKVGDIITNIIKHDGGWWEGTLNGKKGMFPDNFVKELKKEPASGSPAAGKKSQGAGHVAELANKLGNINIAAGANAGVAPHAIKRTEKPVKKKAKVTFGYSPVNDDELRLDVGDIIEIIKQEEEGWWEGSLNGRIGMFPSNFVEIIEAPAPAPTDETAKGETNLIKGKKVVGQGFGNIFGDEGPKLRKTPVQTKEPSAAARQEVSPIQHDPTPPPSVDKAKKANVPPQKVITNAPTLPPKDKKLERARVLYSYTAENEDELSIEEGNIIVVLEKELEDSGWWKGELHGKVGVFPDNFVELLPPEDAPKPKKPPPPAATAAPVVKASPPEPKVEAKVEPPRMQPSKAPDKSQQKVPVNKKPSIPPPVGKKPLHKPDEPVTDDQKAGHHGESPAEASLDAVESGQRLNNVNNNRPPGPSNRRQPANPKTLAQDVSGVEDKNDDIADDPPPLPPDRKKPRPKSVQPPLPPPPVMVARDSNVTRQGDKEESKPAPVKPLLPNAAPAHTSTPQKTAEEPAASASSVPTVQALPTAEIEELKAEIKSLKDNTVSKSSYDELQKELAAIKEEVASQKETLRKRTLELMTEVDEEKKVRLSMQVEIDRLKRLVMS